MKTGSLVFGLFVASFIGACVPTPEDNASATTGTFALKLNGESVVTYEGKGTDPLLYGVQKVLPTSEIQTSINFKRNYQQSSLDYTESLALSFVGSTVQTVDNTSIDANMIAVVYENNGVRYEQSSSTIIPGNSNNAYFSVNVTQYDPPRGRIAADYDGYVCRIASTNTASSCAPEDLLRISGSFNVQNRTGL